MYNGQLKIELKVSPILGCFPSLANSVLAYSFCFCCKNIIDCDLYFVLKMIIWFDMLIIKSQEKLYFMSLHTNQSILAFVVRYLTRRFIGDYSSSIANTYPHNASLDNMVVPLVVWDTLSIDSQVGHSQAFLHNQQNCTENKMKN